VSWFGYLKILDVIVAAAVLTFTISKHRFVAVKLRDTVKIA